MTSILLPPTSSSLPSIFSQHDNSTSDPLSKLGNTIVDRKMAESVSASTATQQAQQQQQNTTTTQPSAQALSPLVSGLVANLTSASENQRCLWEGCNDRFGSAEELYEHICGVHIGRKSTNNLQLVCRWSNCNTTTVKRDHITSHVRVHVPFKPHRCPVCGKSFKRPQDLKKHHKTHAEENSQGQNGHSHGPNGHGSNGANGYGMNGGGGAGSFYGGAGMHNGAAMQFPYTGQNGGGYYQQPAAMSNAYNQAMYYNPDVGAGPGVAYGRRDDDLQAINNLFGTIKQPNFNAASYPQFQSSLAHAHGLILPPPINTHSMDYSSAIDAQYPAHLPQLTNVRSKADLLLLQDRLQKMMHAIDAHDRTQQFTAQAAYGVGPDGRSSFSASSHEQTPDMTPGSSVMSMSPGHSPPADHSPISSAGMLSYPQLQNNLPMSAVSTLGRQYDHNTAQRHGGGYLTRAQPASAHEPETTETTTTTTTKTKKSKDPNIDPELAGNKSSSSSSNASGSPTPQPESRRGSGSETSEKQTGLQRDGRIVNNLLKIINSMLENDQFDKENSASPKSQAATSPAPVEAVPATPAADAMDIDKPETDETVTESEVKPEEESEEAAQPSYPTLPSA